MCIRSLSFQWLPSVCGVIPLAPGLTEPEGASSKESVLVISTRILVENLRELPWATPEGLVSPAVFSIAALAPQSMFSLVWGLWDTRLSKTGRLHDAHFPKEQRLQHNRLCVQCGPQTLSPLAPTPALPRSPWGHRALPIPNGQGSLVSNLARLGGEGRAKSHPIDHHWSTALPSLFLGGAPVRRSRR